MLRDETRRDIAVLRGDHATLRREPKEELASRAVHTDQRIDRLSDAVLKLTDTVGQLKGRTEFLAAAG